MGVIKFFSSSSNELGKPIRGNPDPSKFKITSREQIGNYLLLLVNYPESLNYEGNKILVFKDVDVLDLLAYGKIDPHFSDKLKKYHPIARFVPTDDGMENARILVKQLNKK